MGLNKVNYTSDPSVVLKETAGKLLGASWKQFQKEDNKKFDPSKPYFIVFKDHYIGIDFDVATKAKLLKNKNKMEEDSAKAKTPKDKYAWLKQEIKDKILNDQPIPDAWGLVKAFLERHGFPTQDDQVYIVQSGTGGFHYHARVTNPSNFIMKMGSYIQHFEHISVDYRCGLYQYKDTIDLDNGAIIHDGEGGGGIFYSVGTKWKDTGTYKIFKGSEATIPDIEGWRVAWLLGRFKWEIAHVKLANFLNNSMNKDEQAAKAKHELVVYKEAMYALKELGYTQEEAILVFATLPGYNEADTRGQIKAWWQKGLTDPKRAWAIFPGAKLPPQATKNKQPSTQKPTPVKKEGSGGQPVPIPEGEPGPPVPAAAGSGGPGTPGTPPIPAGGGSTFPLIYISIEIGADEFVMKQDGVYHIITKNFKNGGQKIIRKHVWKWIDFQISNVLIEKCLEQSIDHYNFKVDDKEYHDILLEDIIKQIAPGHYQGATSQEKNILGPLIKEYVKVMKIAVVLYSDVLGFTKDGWRMPDIYWVRYDAPWHAEQRERVEAMIKLTPNADDAKKYVRCLYDNVELATEDRTIKYHIKDICLAFNCIAPFMSALEDHTELMPFLMLISERGGTGKSTFLRLLTETWWGFPGMVINDNFDSPSRANDYLSLSTCPVFIDDISKLSPQHIDKIKAILTGKAKNQKKRADNKGFAINKWFVTPPYFTANEVPDMLDNVKVLERGLVLRPDKKMTEDLKERFEQTKTIPAGQIGRYIYEITKEWKIAKLIELYKQMPRMPKEAGLKTDNTARESAIYKLVKLGGYLFNEWFGFELNLTNLEDAIHGTTKVGSDNIFGIFLGQLEESKKEKRDRPNWIQHEVFDLDGEIRFSNGNLVDLNRVLNKNYSLPGLAEILQKRYPSAKYQPGIRMGEHRGSAVVIQKSDFDKYDKLVESKDDENDLATRIDDRQQDERDLEAGIMTLVMSCLSTADNNTMSKNILKKTVEKGLTGELDWSDFNRILMLMKSKNKIFIQETGNEADLVSYYEV